MGEGISTQTCERTHQGLEKRLQEGTRRMNAHSEDIDDMKVAIVKLTQIQETQTKSYDLMERRVKVLEDERIAEKAAREVQEKENAKKKDPKFWQTDLGKWVIKAAVITAIVVIFSAIGREAIVESITKAINIK